MIFQENLEKEASYCYVAFMNGKERLDKLLLERGLTSTRERARALIMAGQVLVADQVIDKCGALVPLVAEIRIRGGDLPYVSRGGLKLAHALESFSLDPDGLVALDVGASTGGFTDCLLQKGAHRVYAVDVGYGQLAWKLRQDQRVINLEKTNIRYIDRSLIPERPDIAVIDASFISLSKVLPAVIGLIRGNGIIIALIKPQFEVGKGQVGKGGVVRDDQKHQAVIASITREAETLNLIPSGVVESPILGPKGNREFLILLKKQEKELL